MRTASVSTVDERACSQHNQSVKKRKCDESDCVFSHHKRSTFLEIAHTRPPRVVEPPLLLEASFLSVTPTPRRRPEGSTAEREAAPRARSRTRRPSPPRAPTASASPTTAARAPPRSEAPIPPPPHPTPPPPPPGARLLRRNTCRAEPRRIRREGDRDSPRSGPRGAAPGTPTAPIAVAPTEAVVDGGKHRRARGDACRGRGRDQSARARPLRQTFDPSPRGPNCGSAMAAACWRRARDRDRGEPRASSRGARRAESRRCRRRAGPCRARPNARSRSECRPRSQPPPSSHFCPQPPKKSLVAAAFFVAVVSQSRRDASRTTGPPESPSPSRVLLGDADPRTREIRAAARGSSEPPRDEPSRERARRRRPREAPRGVANSGSERAEGAATPCA